MYAISDEGPGPADCPLAGIRVVEMGQLLAGPFCGQLMADFGAEVIKIEPPGAGDPMREWGRSRPKGHSLWWPIVARGKKCVTLNLRSERGQDLARGLIAQADVLVENFRPGTLERWGMGWEELKKVNPGLVLVRVTGFGQTGPYAQQAGYGSIGEAMGGIRYVTGDPERPPSRVGVSLGDALSGMFAALGAMMALRARDRSGEGQVVDVALYESVLAVMESLLPDFALAGHVRERTGSVLPNVAPSNVYPTADGTLVLVAANQDTVFARLAEAMGRPEMATDERYATHTARGEHQAELDQAVAEWTATLHVDKLLRVLHEHSVPCGRIYRAPDMLSDPHFAARDAIIRLPHPDLGEFPMQNVVPKLSATPGGVRWLGPALGEHNNEVFGAVLGLTADEIANLQEEGIL